MTQSVDLQTPVGSDSSEGDGLCGRHVVDSTCPFFPSACFWQSDLRNHLPVIGSMAMITALTGSGTYRDEILNQNCT